MSMSLDKKTIKYIFLGVIGCITFYWLLHETERVASVWNFISTMLAPFAVGAALAFVLNVPMRGIEGLLQPVKKPALRRGLAMVLTILAVAAVIFGIVMLLIPQVNKTIEDIIAQLPGFFRELEAMIRNFLEERPELLEWVQEYISQGSIDWKSLIEKAAVELGNRLSTLFTRAITMVGGVAGAIFNAVVSFVFALYCLGHKDTLARQGRKLLYALAPERFADETVRILRMTNSAFSNFIAGQCVEAVILSLLFVIAMMIFGIPYIPLISVLICVTALVPLVGAFVGCILGAFFILVNDPAQAVAFVIMFLIIQQFEGNVIYPRVVGSSIGLPGMWVLLAVTVGGEVMGVGGMLLMVPFASVLYTLLREFTHKRLEKRRIDADKLTPQPPEPRARIQLLRKKKKAVPPKTEETAEE